VFAELGTRHGGANAKALGGGLNAAQFGDALEVDNQRRADHPSAQLDEKIGATGQYASTDRGVSQTANRIVDALRLRIFHSVHVASGIWGGLRFRADCAKGAGNVYRLCRA
jgi:hypothetical protein